MVGGMALSVRDKQGIKARYSEYEQIAAASHCRFEPEFVLIESVESFEFDPRMFDQIPST